MPLDVRMGDVIEMRKQHPCGSHAWTVVRVGADIGLRCNSCERRILMDRPTLHRRAKLLLERGEAIDPAIDEAIFGAGAIDEALSGAVAIEEAPSGAGATEVARRGAGPAAGDSLAD